MLNLFQHPWSAITQKRIFRGKLPWMLKQVQHDEVLLVVRPKKSRAAASLRRPFLVLRRVPYLAAITVNSTVKFGPASAATCMVVRVTVVGFSAVPKNSAKPALKPAKSILPSMPGAAVR